MDINLYDYNLPEELIAQTPLLQRDSSRLIVVDRSDESIEDKSFTNIVDYFNSGDVIVMNDSKVIPARLFGIKEETDAHIELLLLKDEGNDVWECLAKPSKRLHIGTVVSFGDGVLKCEVVSKGDEGLVKVRFLYEGIFLEVLESLGEMPLPPYIHEKLEDKNRYQTVYAKNVGSAAAPTAGLHFTKDLMSQLESKGVKILYVTLHVGLGTFRPVTVENILDHDMHSEYYTMDSYVASELNACRSRENKIVAVGTTSVRVLETIYNKYGKFISESGNTNIFIYPGYNVKAVDMLITNFHLPKSTLFMLISAMAGRELVMKAYEHAVEEKYRFFSFGDAMLIK